MKVQSTMNYVVQRPSSDDPMAKCQEKEDIQQTATQKKRKTQKKSSNLKQNDAEGKQCVVFCVNEILRQSCMAFAADACTFASGVGCHHMLRYPHSILQRSWSETKLPTASSYNDRIPAFIGNQ